MFTQTLINALCVHVNTRVYTYTQHTHYTNHTNQTPPKGVNQTFHNPTLGRLLGGSW